MNLLEKSWRSERKEFKITIEEKTLPPAEPEPQKRDKPKALPGEEEASVPLTGSPNETLFNEPETSSPTTDNLREALLDEPETPPLAFAYPARVPAAHKVADSLAHNWRYLIAGMGLAIVAMLLGAVLGYLARPALDAAYSGTAAAQKPATGPAPAAATSAAAPAAKSVANLIARSFRWAVIVRDRQMRPWSLWSMPTFSVLIVGVISKRSKAG
jgi:hypothetical protein